MAGSAVCFAVQGITFTRQPLGIEWMFGTSATDGDWAPHYIEAKLTPTPHPTQSPSKTVELADIPPDPLSHHVEALGLNQWLVNRNRRLKARVRGMGDDG